MPKNSYIRIFLIFGMSLIFILSGCVDTNVEPIPRQFNFRSLVKVVNLAPDVASADFTMTTHAGETISLGTIAYGDENQGNFIDVPAGSKQLKFNSETVRFSTETDKKERAFLIGTSASERKVISFSQRYIFQTKDDTTIYPADTLTAVAFANGAPELTITKVIAATATDTMDLKVAISYGDNGFTSYQYIKPGDYTFSVVSKNKAGNADTVMTSFQATLGAKGRYTAVVYGNNTNLAGKVFTDD